MNQQSSTNSNIVITSKHFINQIEVLIIQITRAIAIEQSLKPDPEAKEITRSVLQNKINYLLTKEAKADIKDLFETTTKRIRTSKEDTSYEKKVYELCKLLNLDKLGV